jgi:hypothetical protein
MKPKRLKVFIFGEYRRSFLLRDAGIVVVRDKD